MDGQAFAINLEKIRQRVKFEGRELLALAGVLSMVLQSSHDEEACESAREHKNQCDLARRYMDVAPDMVKGWGVRIGTLSREKADFLATVEDLRVHFDAAIPKLLRWYASHEETPSQHTAGESVSCIFFITTAIIAMEPLFATTCALLAGTHISGLRMAHGDDEAYGIVVSALKKVHDLVPVMIDSMKEITDMMEPLLKKTHGREILKGKDLSPFDRGNMVKGGDA